MSQKERRRFTGNELLDMAERIRAGQGITDLTRAYSTNAVALYRVLASAGIPRPSILGPTRLETIRRLRAVGKTLHEIAAVLGCSPWTAHSYMKRAGIKLPKGGHTELAEARADKPDAHKNAQRKRACLACRTAFTSRWAGNRRCAACLKSASAQDSPYAV